MPGHDLLGDGTTPMSSSNAPTASTELDGTSQTLDPRMRKVWTITAMIWAVVLGGGAIAVTIGFKAPAYAAGLAAGFATLLVIRAIAWPALTWKNWRWAAWPDGIELHHGVITRHESFVPYHRIQQIDVHRGPIERMVGLSTLTLRTAAATTDCQIPGVAAEHAEVLRHELMARAGVDDAV